MSLSKIENYLIMYKEEVQTPLNELEYIKQSYQYFQQYRDPTYIEAMEWEDFQEIGNHVNAYRMGISRSRAFGKKNAPLEKYRNSFLYLVHGDDPMDVRMDKFLTDPDYKLFGIGENALSEMIGNIFPEKYCFYNQRDRVALENVLEINPHYERGDSFSEKFIKFQKALMDHKIVEKYEKIVGRLTDLPILFEIDQFFSFIFEKNKANSNELTESERQYWMMSAGANSRLWNVFKNKGQISIGWSKMGDLRKYKNKNEITEKLRVLYNLDHTPTNDSLANQQFLEEIKEGDYVLIKHGIRKIIALGKVTSPYKYDRNNGDHHSYRNVEWLLEGNWDISDLPVATKTLTNITSYEQYLETILSRIGKIPSPGPAKTTLELTKYNIDDFSKDVFMDIGKVEDAIESLDYKQNIILQGPPGVGKTFVAKRLAYLHQEKKCDQNIEMIQFHQSYSYEEFINGFKPTEDGHFKLQEGLFYSFCKRAQQNPEQNFYFIIDEINRGNLSKIFGEVMMLIEADKRGSEYAIKLTYSEGDDKFYIPKNVYLIATMNTADRSLAMVDYALRRRFAFIDLVPGFHTDAFELFLKKMEVSKGFIDKIRNFMEEVNKEIIQDTVNLGRGFEIGHSYFTPTEKVTDEQSWFNRIIRLEIKPLLNEYWFDQEEKVNDLIQKS